MYNFFFRRAAQNLLLLNAVLLKMSVICRSSARGIPNTARTMCIKWTRHLVGAVKR